MKRSFSIPVTPSFLAVLLALFSLAAPGSLVGQERGEVPSASQEEWTSFGKAYMEISGIASELRAELALPESKSQAAQARIRESTQRRIQQVLQRHGLSQDRYSQLTFVIGTNDEQRDAFTRLLAELSAQGGAGGA